MPNFQVNSLPPTIEPKIFIFWRSIVIPITKVKPYYKLPCMHATWCHIYYLFLPSAHVWIECVDHRATIVVVSKGECNIRPITYLNLVAKLLLLKCFVQVLNMDMKEWHMCLTWCCVLVKLFSLVTLSIHCFLGD